MSHDGYVQVTGNSASTNQILISDTKCTENTVEALVRHHFILILYYQVIVSPISNIELISTEKFVIAGGKLLIGIKVLLLTVFNIHAEGVY